MMSELTQENFEKITGQGNSIIDFHADWCGPCKVMVPVFDKLDKEFDNVGFYKVDVDANQEIASTYDVRSIPTIIFLKDGKEVERIIGLLDEGKFKNKIKEAFE